MAEILAPAGNRESFEAAVEAGADAIYLALPKFGARASAKNFDWPELEAVTKTARTLGVKLYVTMNTILYEDEIEEAFQQAKRLYELGVDAVIVQDLGLMHLLKHRLPQMEVHASTQLSVNRKGQLEKLKQLGVKRTVLARECTLEQIKELCQVPDMEIEVFVHGALCISWSGQCQFSQVRSQRSGNRGACAQYCRMEYELTEDGKKVETKGNFLLSPRDISVFHRIPDLEKAGVDSLKIEGRMKSPAYVYEAVKSAQNQRKPDDNLKAAFNRTYSDGHLTGSTGNTLMNPVAPGHQGVPIGTVMKATKDRVFIKLDADIHQEDGIRFVWEGKSEGAHANFIHDSHDKLTNMGRKGETISIPIARFIQNGAKVYKTIDAFHTKEIKRETDQQNRKRNIAITLAGKANEPLTLTMKAGETEVTVETEPTQTAKKPADKERIKEALKKLGDTRFEAETVEINMADDVFIPVKALNEARRKAAQKLEEALTEKREAKETEYKFKPETESKWQTIVQIQKPEQRVEGEDTVFISEFPIPKTEKKASIREDAGYVTGHLGEGKILSDMNITNSYGIAAALEMGYETVILSPELDKEQVLDIAEAWKARYHTDIPAIVPVYGKPRLMLMQHCPVNTAIKDGKRKDCALCRQHRYELTGLDGKKAWMYGDAGCNMQLFDETPVNRLDWIPDLKKAGFAGIKLDMADETKESVCNSLQQVKTVETSFVNA